jgi:hypothetical protein
MGEPSYRQAEDMLRSLLRGASSFGVPHEQRRTLIAGLYMDIKSAMKRGDVPEEEVENANALLTTARGTHGLYGSSWMEVVSLR